MILGISLLIWFSVIGNIIFLLQPMAWVAATAFGVFFWLFTDYGWDSLYRFQLMGFFFTIPGYLGYGSVGSAVFGYGAAKVMGGGGIIK